jgi:hypothetical protein
LELWEIERYGRDSYRDADYVSVYGMRPTEWYARGVRLLGRTAVECTRDELADSIARDVAAIAAIASARLLIIDAFAGSANTLHWMLRRLPGAAAIGFELDVRVFELTRSNLAHLAIPIELANADYLGGLSRLSPAGNDLVIAFVAPPWGEALSADAGLDLRRTLPPIATIIDAISDRFDRNRLLFAVQIYERVDAASLADLKGRFDWSGAHVYQLNAPGQNHGIVLGTRGWSPSAGGVGPVT